MNGRVVLALLFLVGGAGVAMAGVQPQAALTPGQAVEETGNARVKGVVDTVDRANNTFVLAGDGHELTVRMNALPAAVRPGNSLLAQGEILLEQGTRVLQAEEIQMGCPSKYGA